MGLTRFVSCTSRAADLLRSTVAFLPDVHQPVSTVGDAVGLVRTGNVQETRASHQQHLLQVVGAAAAEVLGAPAEGEQRVNARAASCTCVNTTASRPRVSRGAGVHDAGGDGAAAGAPVVVVHPEVVTEFVSHDGGKRVDFVVDELRKKIRV